jgi:hypothetical protein
LAESSDSDDDVSFHVVIVFIYEFEVGVIEMVKLMIVLLRGG